MNCMSGILEQIVDVKRQELKRRKEEEKIYQLEDRIGALPLPLNLSGSLMGGGVRLIAEAKKASPSKGILRDNYDPFALASIYAQHGAAAMSVLTEVDHFQGSLDHINLARRGMGKVSLPILRKDFIFDPYQVYEARAYGADALLLIVAILSPGLLKELLDSCRKLWMQALVEVHNLQELEWAIDAGAEIIGVNNRNLRTFETSLSTTEELVMHFPNDKIIVSESGIKSSEDISKLHRMGVHAALVGEAIVTQEDPGAKIRELIGV